MVLECNSSDLYRDRIGAVTVLGRLTAIKRTADQPSSLPERIPMQYMIRVAFGPNAPHCGMGA